jgi:hypothetical protein
VAGLVGGVREVERRVRQAGEQARKRAAGRVPAAEYASDVPVREFALQLGRPALALDLVSTVRDRSIKRVDVRPTRRSATAAERLKGHFIFCQTELVGWHQREGVVRQGQVTTGHFRREIGKTLQRKVYMLRPRVREV